MMIKSSKIKFDTSGDCDIIDITEKIKHELEKTDAENGIISLFCIGSTAGITTCEYEPGLVADIKELFGKIIPKNASYNHDNTWGDGNGHSHLRASLLGASLTIPVIGGRLALGTWQQVIFIDFDNRPRRRELIIQFYT